MDAQGNEGNHPVMSCPLDVRLPPSTVFAHLDAGVQRLVIAAQTLYGGNWDACAEDLLRRHVGQPYLYRLKLEIEDAPGWLARLKTYEQARGERFAVDAQVAKDHH